MPLIAGFILQKRWNAWAARNSRRINIFDKSIVLLIVYKSFAASFSAGVFEAIEWMDIATLAFYSVMLFVLVYTLLFLLSNLIHFSKEDRITAVFCGSKKSLIHGTVFSKVLFKNTVGAGIILLPLMIFDALQILIVSTIAARMEKKYSEDAAVHSS